MAISRQVAFRRQFTQWTAFKHYVFDLFQIIENSARDGKKTAINPAAFGLRLFIKAGHAIIWRQLADDPKFDTSHYHGLAERHWGLVRADGAAKPALALFVAGTRLARGEGLVARATP